MALRENTALLLRELRLERGVAIGCNYSFRLMNNAGLIPDEITRLEDATTV